MGAKLRTVRRRIRSVQSTMKITRAMELIAASRIMRAQQRVAAARPYAEQLTKAMEDVARQTGALVHPLLEERPDPKRAAVFLVTSDRGLAGAYNANVIRRAERVMGRLRGDNVEPVLFAVGRKGLSYLRFRQIPVAEAWSGFSEVPAYGNAEEIAGKLLEAFEEREVDAVHAVYTDFRSAFTLRPVDRRFLPIAPEEVSGEPGEIPAEYIFEPPPEELLGELLPRYFTALVFHSMLESAASEHASRRRAMKAATENAEDLIRRLTRVANQARQAEITTELMEIVGGAEAQKQATEAR